MKGVIPSGISELFRQSTTIKPKKQKMGGI